MTGFLSNLCLMKHKEDNSHKDVAYKLKAH